GAAEGLTAAGRGLTAAVGRCARTALGILETGGHGAGADTDRRIQSMLRAAALGDEAVRAALRDGRLTAEPEPDGFGGLDAMPLAAPAPPAGAGTEGPRRPGARQRRPGTPAAPPPAPPAEARMHRLEMERIVAERRAAAEQAERAVAASRGTASATRAEIVGQETTLERLRSRLAAEESELRAAEASAAAARAALDRALTVLD
ncbi:MAG TPA: hypothetical protein VFO60_03445, partial [Candidatus Dormibacteraeota bacterium]|nr:hypothetical protein [Candidatus Dormibacteraeota bacterium]